MEEKRKYEVPKPKFKVGDYVRVLPRKVQRYQLPNYLDDMLKFEGKVFKIRYITNHGNYCLEGNFYIWHEDWLEPAYKLSIPKEQIDALFNEKVLVHSSFYDKCWEDDYRKYILGHREVDVKVANELYYDYLHELWFTIDYSEEPYYDYLPTKVVFNEKLKRTTLVFRNPNEQFDVVRSEAKDEYNEYLGFLVAMVKYLYKEQAKRHIDYGYKRYNKFKNNIQNYLEQLIRQDIKLSDYQLEKLFDNITKKDQLKFNIDGNIHEIEIERK